MISMRMGLFSQQFKVWLMHHMRSVALAFIFLLANLIGFGLGPLAVGLLSDLLVQTLARIRLRYALAAFSPGLLWVGLLLLEGLLALIEADIRSVESQAGSTKLPNYPSV